MSEEDFDKKLRDLEERISNIQLGTLTRTLIYWRENNENRS